MSPKQVQVVNLYMAIGLLTLLLPYDYINLRSNSLTL